MKEINIFFEGVDSIEGYQSELLKRIDKEIHFNKCIFTEKCHDGQDVYDSERYIPINYDICERNRYEEYCDVNKLLPLDAEILEKMLPYESTALKMFVRNMEQEIYTYDESKRLYLDHLRFWNLMFITHNINYVIQTCVPHHVHDYIIYGLAKIYKCKHVINTATSIWNHWIPVEDIYGNDTTLVRRYNDLRQSKEDYELSEFVEHYYQSLLYKNKDLDKNLINAGMSRKQIMAQKREFYKSYFSMKNKIKRNKTHWKNLVLRGLLKGNGGEIVKRYESIRTNRDFAKRSSIKAHQMRSIKYYDKISGMPDYEECFVVFFLHYQPEATTLPQAGVFVEQEIIVSLLADTLAKRGIVLYVKEHFVQPYRQKVFYDRLKKMPNVRLIRSDIDSKELLQHSLAAATCNGTVIQESIFNGKPILTFGNGPFNGAPGTYQCRTAADIENAVSEIEKGACPSAHDVRAYLKAFDETAVHTNIYPAMKNRRCDISMDESIVNMKAFVVRWVQENC